MSIRPLLHAILLSTMMLVPMTQAKTIERAFSATPGGMLELHTQVGSITIETHDSHDILVDINIDGDDENSFNVEFDHTGTDLRIVGEREGKRWWGNNRVRVDYVITVPKQYNVDLNTAGGRIQTDDLQGNVYARTSGGSVSVGNIHGNVDLKTSGGLIRTEDIYGEIDAHTSGGGIDVTFAKQPERDAKLRTSGGSIYARFPDNVQITLNASTSGGRVSTEFNVDGRIKKRSIDGEINGGGPTISLHTSGGSVSVDKI